MNIYLSFPLWIFQAGIAFIDIHFPLDKAVYLKEEGAADGGLFLLLFLQVLPIAAVSYAIACAFAGDSYAAVLRFCPFLQAGLAAAMLVPLAVLAANPRQAPY